MTAVSINEFTTNSNPNCTIVGWDSEFQDGLILSHQLFILKADGTECQVFIDCTGRDPHSSVLPSGVEYIWLKEPPTLEELILPIKNRLPGEQTIYLVSHFNFAEFASLKDGRNAVSSRLGGKELFTQDKSLLGKILDFGLTIYPESVYP